MGKKILISWLGITDLKAAGQIPSRPDEIIADGPILGALKTLAFDELHLIHEQEQSNRYFLSFLLLVALQKAR